MDSLILHTQNDPVDEPTGIELDENEDYSSAVRTNSDGSQEIELTVRPKTNVFLGGNTVLTASLTQEQTALFESGSIKVQVNWVTSDGTRYATDIVKIPSFDNLYEEEI